MVTILLEASTTPQETSKPLITCLNESRELLLKHRGEADADFSKTLDLSKASFLPLFSPEAQDGEKGSMTGSASPQASSVTQNTASGVAGAAFGYVI